MRKMKMIADLKDSIKDLKEFIAASEGKESSCGSFEHFGTRTIPPTNNFSIYLESWVLPKMVSTLAELEGKRND